MTKQAWRIYYKDAIDKTELTQSPARREWALETGNKVGSLYELKDIVNGLADIGVVVFSDDDGSLKFSRYVEVMGS